VRDVVEAIRDLDGVAGGTEGHVRTDQHPITDRDAPKVEEVAALVDEDLLAELDVETVIAVERRLDRDVGGQRSAEDLAEELVAPVEVAERQDVEPRGQFHDRLDAFREQA